MNLLLRLLQPHTPTSLEREGLKEVFTLTAAAFQREAPSLEGLSHADILHRFALFTKGAAEEAILAGRDLHAIKGRLYRGAYALGRRLRKRLCVTSLEEALVAARIVYRTLDIDFRGNPRGEVTINRCFFSRFYSSQVCDLISALDEGVIAGLSGGGRIVFTQRITEGKDCCRACLSWGASLGPVRRENRP
jgi:hypothetical protein